MTPMMRTATVSALSQWKLRGDYLGQVHLTVSGGYTMARDEWYWDRAELRERHDEERRDVPTEYIIDMSDAYLYAEPTVLIRTMVGSGMCLTDEGRVELRACNPRDRNQRWGLDPERRYVNRGSNRCLTADQATGDVVTQSCDGLRFEQQWQWRADRLHSLANHARHRLYVEGSQVRFLAPTRRFDDYPATPFSAALYPWTSYPNAPIPRIDTVPSPAGRVTDPVSEAWAIYRPVDDAQRWHLEVLRPGIQ
jgi:hemolysin